MKYTLILIEVTKVIQWRAVNYSLLFSFVVWLTLNDCKVYNAAVTLRLNADKLLITFPSVYVHVRLNVWMLIKNDDNAQKQN